MTVRVQWDEDEPKTGLPDSGEDTKTYEETATSGTVTVSHEQSDATQTVTFDLPLPVDGGDGEVTPDKTEVDPGGDEAARTISVSGTGFPASTEGTVTLMTGAPGEAGDEVDSATVTTDANGAFDGATVVVPEGAEPGDYHIVVTVGDVTSDNTGITVGGGGDEPSVTVEPDEAAPGETFTVGGTGFPADTEGIAELVPGAPGEAGEAVGSAEFTTDAEGAFVDAALSVPEGTAEGDYHVVVTVGSVVHDDSPVTVGAGTGATITPDKTEVDSSGDEAARTITVTGAGFPAETAGTVALMSGAPGSGGDEVATVDVTTDADGGFADAAVVVPEGQAEGDYHLVATVGETVVDDTAITVTGGAAEATLTPDVTEVDSSGDEAARTITVDGAGFPAETAGTVELVPGAPGEAGEAVASVDVTTDVDGAFTGAALVVPEAQAAGDYHLVGTVAETVSDDTAITVTDGGGGEAAVTVAPTEVDGTGDEAARTLTVSGTGFDPETAGSVALMSGAAGGGGAQVARADVTADADGNLPETALVVPENQAAGEYHVLAVTGETTGESETVTVTGLDGLPAPTNLSASNETAETVDVTADTVDGAQGYVWRILNPDTNIWNEVEQQATPDYTMASLNPGTTYDTQVKAVGDGTASADSLWSETLQITTAAAAARKASAKRATKKR